MAPRSSLNRVSSPSTLYRHSNIKCKKQKKAHKHTTVGTWSSSVCTCERARFNSPCISCINYENLITRHYFKHLNNISFPDDYNGQGWASWDVILFEMKRPLWLQRWDACASEAWPRLEGSCYRNSSFSYDKWQKTVMNHSSCHERVSYRLWRSRLPKAWPLHRNKNDVFKTQIECTPKLTLIPIPWSMQVAVVAQPAEGTS